MFSSILTCAPRPGPTVHLWDAVAGLGRWKEEQAFGTRVSVRTPPPTAPKLSWLKLPIPYWLLKLVTAFQSSSTGPLSKLQFPHSSSLKRSLGIHHGLYTGFGLYTRFLATSPAPLC